jgi:hypothetical protein
MRNCRSALTLVFLAAVANNARADTFDFSGAIVTYTIPTTGVYDIVAAGAQGGTDGTGLGTGGLGAVIGGDVLLTAGTVLDIVVGGLLRVLVFQVVRMVVAVVAAAPLSLSRFRFNPLS